MRISLLGIVCGLLLVVMIILVLGEYRSEPERAGALNPLGPDRARTALAGRMATV
jgi:hypothetical protein